MVSSVAVADVEGTLGGEGAESNAAQRAPLRCVRHGGLHPDVVAAVAWIGNRALPHDSQ